jgi:adenylate cyclase class 2
MQEIEAKYYVRDLKKIEVCLQDLGAHLIQPRVRETNIRFDLPDASLRSQGRVLRLRQDTEARLTYKSPSIRAQGVSNRTEIEFVVEDFEQAKLFLEALGYRKLLQYEKYRTTYSFTNNHVMLDELPYGNFVEIEGRDVAAIHGVSDKLKLDIKNSIAASYSALFERLRQNLGLTFTDLAFANFEGINILPELLQVQPADE